MCVQMHVASYSSIAGRPVTSTTLSSWFMVEAPGNMGLPPNSSPSMQPVPYNCYSELISAWGQWTSSSRFEDASIVLSTRGWCAAGDKCPGAFRQGVETRFPEGSPICSLVSKPPLQVLYMQQALPPAAQCSIET